jgi:hypothetical protein
MNELNNLIDKALEKAKQDLNNEKVEVKYTPEFLIELLEEIKEVANAKPKGDVYEIRKKYSSNFEDYRFYIYKNDFFVTSKKSMDIAIAYLEKIKSISKSEVLHREEVANV